MPNAVHPASPGRAGEGSSPAPGGYRPAIAVVIPALDEAANVGAALASIADRAFAVVLADGGSVDATVSIAAATGALVVTAPRGRASQMNAGAAALPDGWDVVLFLHADTALPPDWDLAVARAVTGGANWGRFDVWLPSRRRLLALVAFLINARSRLTGICTGDQAIFVSAAAWRQVGGFPSIALMEDIELSARLRRLAGSPAALRQKVASSARRWERAGVLRTIVAMWLLRLRYFVGESPDSLHRRYYGRPR
jgi:rSAM/selenodomain-associated transferase 2